MLVIGTPLADPVFQKSVQRQLLTVHLLSTCPVRTLDE